MISGRGLGHTGGTLDKLEAIPGFRTHLTLKGFERQIGKLGCAMIGQTDDLAPADRRLYALRDVTATVESVPLITASILSKKLAEDIDGLVLDVKVGRGAFMKSLKEARELARALVTVGRKAGVRVTAVLSRMDTPLGLCVGNALETAEAFEVLHGRGPADLIACTMTLAVEMLRLGGITASPGRASRILEDAIRSGLAAETARRLIEAQGGDPRVVARPQRLPRAPRVIPVRSNRAAHIADLDALAVGRLAMQLGAGRTRAEDSIDRAVGIVLAAKPGDRVKKGEILAHLHMNKTTDEKQAARTLRSAYSFSSRPPKRRPLIIETILR
jgi:pyrimidine-nucleoside phosphorylase